MKVPHALGTHMVGNHLEPSMPAWKIVEGANLKSSSDPRKLFADAEAAALGKLMNSFYEYGRKHWTWTQSSTPAANKGGLVLGKTASAACGSINFNFAYLAEYGLNIKGLEPGSKTDQFITGGTGIDHAWPGNVLDNDGDLIPGLYKFNGHYWVRKAVAYDACFNRNRVKVLTELKVDDVLAKELGREPHDVLKVSKPISGTEGDYLVLREKDDGHGWPLWQVVSKRDLRKRG